MHFSKQVVVVGFFYLVLGLNSAMADGVFTNKVRGGHQLSANEERQINLEFLKRFGEPKAAAPVRSNNPWEAKKQRQDSPKNISWGDCRDYALQMRNLCYKQGRDAYNCERFYEARSRKCDADY